MISIRPGVREDVEFVLANIRELAEFEKLSHLFEGNADALTEHLFGAKPSCELLIGELDSKASAYALFFTTYSTFLTRPGIFLEDLFVVTSARGRGLGKALLVELAKLATSRGCGRLEWSVLDWNSRAIGFYDSLGASAVRGWIPYRIDGAGLEALAKR